MLLKDLSFAWRTLRRSPVFTIAAAATISNGGFYTLATAEKVFDDLKRPERVRLNEPCPPIELWNQPVVYVLIVLLFAAEWLLRKRERLL